MSRRWKRKRAGEPSPPVPKGEPNRKPLKSHITITEVDFVGIQNITNVIRVGGDQKLTLDNVGFYSGEKPPDKKKRPPGSA